MALFYAAFLSHDRHYRVLYREQTERQSFGIRNYPIAYLTVISGKVSGQKSEQTKGNGVIHCTLPRTLC
jgi:hypothetical protein